MPKPGVEKLFNKIDILLHFPANMTSEETQSVETDMTSEETQSVDF